MGGVSNSIVVQLVNPHASQVSSWALELTKEKAVERRISGMASSRRIYFLHLAAIRLGERFTKIESREGKEPFLQVGLGKRGTPG